MQDSALFLCTMDKLVADNIHMKVKLNALHPNQFYHQ